MQVGERALGNAELLAIILRTGTGDENVVRLSERLLAQFDGLAGIGRASLKELQTVKGIGPAKAVEIKAALEVGRRFMAASPEDKVQIKSPNDAANLLMGDMMWLEQEHLRVVLLDTRHRVLATPTIYQGSLNSAIVRVAELFRAAIRDNAAALLVAHNHPSGDPTPSKEDVAVTHEIVKAGKLLGIKVLDHLVIGRNRFVSLKEQGIPFE